MKIKFKKLNNRAKLPEFQTEFSAGADLFANISDATTLKPGERKIIPLGFSMEIPAGFEAQIRSRSGLAFKHGICLANGIGTIDADYRGEVGVILINLGQENFEIQPGDRIAQMIFTEFKKPIFEETNQLSDTQRNKGGFGSTGKN